ncbi:hypothetical protein CJU89_1268 [Yarrowia sp. B02]|nr:hypothetical protein CJU89_1268 [Yarrowia sp. B02]
MSETFISGVSSDPSRLEFSLQSPALCLAWSGDNLIYGYNQGVTVLMRKPRVLGNQFASEWSFVPSEYHLGLACELIATAVYWVAVAHDDNTISLINLANDAVERTDVKRGHYDFVNGIDVNADGMVASVGDDRQLLIYNDKLEVVHKIKLDGAGRAVKFQEEGGPRLVVLEGSNRLNVYDWEKGQFLYTVYSNDVVGGSKKIGCCGPPAAVKAVSLTVGPNNSDLLTVLGSGWWRKYSSANLQGGGGHTVPNLQGELYGSRQLRNAVFCIGHDDAAVVSDKKTFFYSLLREESVKEVEYDFVSGVEAAAVRERGEIVAVADGRRLVLLHSGSNGLVRGTWKGSWEKTLEE